MAGCEQDLSSFSPPSEFIRRLLGSSWLLKYFLRPVRVSMILVLTWFAHTRPKLASFLFSPKNSAVLNQRDWFSYNRSLSLSRFEWSTRANLSITSFRTTTAILCVLASSWREADMLEISFDLWNRLVLVVLALEWKSSPRASIMRSLIGFPSSFEAFWRINAGRVVVSTLCMNATVGTGIVCTYSMLEEEDNTSSAWQIWSSLSVGSFEDVVR